MYDKIARFYDSIYSWKDYKAEVDVLVGHIRERVPRATTLLDVACGTGRHLELLKDRFDVAGLDASAQMLEVARSRLPDVPLTHADIRLFDLGARFDVVTCLFGSIAHVKTLEAARTAVANLVRHVAPGGLLLLEPWVAEDAWEDGRRIFSLAHDFPEGKVAMMSASTRAERVATLDVHYLIGMHGSVEHIVDSLEGGVWTRAEYRALVENEGLDTDYDPVGLMDRGLVIGVKPG